MVSPLLAQALCLPSRSDDNRYLRHITPPGLSLRAGLLFTPANMLCRELGFPCNRGKSEQNALSMTCSPQRRQLLLRCASSAFGSRCHVGVRGIRRFGPPYPTCKTLHSLVVGYPALSRSCQSARFVLTSLLSARLNEIRAILLPSLRPSGASSILPPPVRSDLVDLDCL